MGNDEAASLRRRVEELEAELSSLRDSKEFLRALVESIPEFVMRATPQGEIVYINHYAPGFDAEMVRGKTMYDFVDAAYHERIRICTAKVLQTGEPDGYELIGVGPHGHPRYYYTRVGAVRDGDKVTGLTLVATDISSIKDAELMLRESKEKLRLALEGSKIGLWSWDARDGSLDWDAAICQIFGTDVPATKDTEHEAFVHELDRERVRAHNARCLESGIFEDLEYRIITLRGDSRWLLAKGTVLKDQQGRVVKVVGGLLDITEQRALLQHNEQASKLEALGLLSAGLAHNFNNLLASIVPALELSLRSSPKELHPLLENARRATERAAELVKQMMVFSVEGRRPDRGEPLTVVARRVVEIAESIVGDGIQLDLSIIDPLPQILVDPTQMQHALLNLISNAKEALNGVPEPRRIELRLSKLKRDTLLAKGTSDFVAVSVHDNGVGMSEETRKHAFDPFFTTRTVGKGVGLGLTVVFAVARKHGGFAECESLPNVGTTVNLILPVQPEVPQRPRLHTPAEPVLAQRARILLVDDEDLVRHTIARILQSEGYEILEAAGGEEALDKFQQAAPPVNLVILDQSMPRMSGAAVLRQLLSLNPKAKVIGFSGYGTKLDGSCATLTKPVNTKDLLACVADVLNGTHSN